MRTLVMKFGGSSIGMTTGLTQMVRVLLAERERWQRLVVVVSALDGVTDALLDAAQQARSGNRRGYRRIIATLRTRHSALLTLMAMGPAEHASLHADIDRLLYELLDWCQELASGQATLAREEALTDAIVGAGERLAARIVASLLRNHQLLSVAVDATDLIVSDTTHGHASPDYALSRSRCRTVLLPLLERRILPIVTGFIAMGTHNQPTTLGRGGSDLTAAVLAIALDADEVWLWTDVDGMMSADPSKIPDAHSIAEISYDEAADLAFFGARILHAHMVRPLATAGIDIRICNINRPGDSGTRIHGNVPNGPAIRSVTSTAGVGLVAAVSGSVHEAIGFVDSVLQDLTGSHIEATLVAQSAGKSIVCFVIPASAGLEAPHDLLVNVQERLPSRGVEHWEAHPISVLTLAGAMHSEQVHTLAAALGAVDDLGVLAASINPSGVSVSLAVDGRDEPDALERLHTLVARS